MRKDLQGLRPELSGSKLSIDMTSLPGVADAFDAVIGRAQGVVEHANAVGREKRQIDAQDKKDMLDRFKKNQGL